MPQFLYAFCAWILKTILSLRYRIELKNFKELQKKCLKGSGGYLFLPNHPAQIDPIIMNAVLAHPFRPCPLVVEQYYNLPGARFFMNLVKAVPIPNFEISTNTWKIRKVEKCLEQVGNQLKNGDNFLIYPSGQLKREGKEVVGGNSFIHRILETCPETKVVLVRTTGLWGSLFSYAIGGNPGDFWKVLLKGFKIVLKNGIFFAPKRKVTIEFEEAPADFPYKGTRLQLNQYLEKWYNQYRDEKGHVTDREPLKFVSFSAFRNEIPKLIEKKAPKKRKTVEVSEDIKATVYRELSRMTNRPAKEMDESMDLSSDLGLDSLDLGNLHAFLDQRYEVATMVPEEVRKVEDVFHLIAEGKPEAASSREDQGPVEPWPTENERPELSYPEGKTIQEVFFNACDRMGNHIACADGRTKALSYHRLKLGALILAEKFKKFPDRYVGVLLPSSVGAYLSVLAVLLAGKIPVILNWTAGARSLNFAHNLLDLKVVISSSLFLERLESLDLGELGDKIVVLEELRSEISFFDKLTGLWLARKNSAKLMKRLELSPIQEEEPAVILFTSGTETYPKAVPLSHHNLISNQRGALSKIELRSDDILYGVLPPFHSFGCSITGLMPILSGLRVFYAPDPTDSHMMAQDTMQRKITLHCCAPSFYHNLFRVAKPEQLKTVRLFVSGAEKAPEALFQAVEKLGSHTQLIEGYGITECSPVVTICPTDKPARGVGQPLDDVELCVIDSESGQKLDPGSVGEVCIKGPNVFSGYLGMDVPDPFIEIDGTKWYRSGDRGRIDEDGFLIFEGRLKRFVKIGGEMVSLAALEDELNHHGREMGWFAKGDEAPQLAVGVHIKPGSDKPILVLFTAFEVSLQDVNAALREKGFARIVKVHEVKQIPEIPMTGTGKVQFRVINEMAQE